ncbi:MAG: phosphate ABC transporter substrate-binding/OmpA family protein [Pseudomonadota bacterium]
MKRTTLCSLAFAALGVAAASTGALSAEVLLRSNDGSIDVTGELLDFSDGVYTVRTSIGPLRLSAARVRCEGEGCPVIDVSGADVTLSGSDTVGEELMPLLLAGYAARFEAEADVQTGSRPFEKAVSLIGDGGFGDEITSFSVISRGSSTGFEDLLAGEAEIAMSSRSVRPAEAEAFASAGHGDLTSLGQERILAVDSLRVIVHPDNPVDTISFADLAAVFAGEITNWSALGGPDAPISVYSRNTESGTFDTFQRRMMRPARKEVSPNAEVLPGHIEISKAVTSDPGGIGYVGFAFERGAKTLDLRTACDIVVRADEFSAKTEEYPLERRLYLYAKNGEMSDHAQGLFDYAATEAVDGLVSKAGFVNLGVKRRGQEDAANRVRDLIEATDDPFETNLMRQLYIEMLEYDRLSTTFRFAPGASVLDNKALRDLDRIANFLAAQPGAEVAVVGFTDSDGPFSSNLSLAERRAAQVLAELRRVGGDRLAGVDIQSRGFGELSPSACNETFDGRKINRRVEIWINNQS